MSTELLAVTRPEEYLIEVQSLDLSLHTATPEYNPYLFINGLYNSLTKAEQEQVEPPPPDPGGYLYSGYHLAADCMDATDARRYVMTRCFGVPEELAWCIQGNVIFSKPGNEMDMYTPYPGDGSEVYFDHVIEYVKKRYEYELSKWGHNWEAPLKEALMSFTKISGWQIKVKASRIHMSENNIPPEMLNTPLLATRDGENYQIITFRQYLNDSSLMSQYDALKKQIYLKTHDKTHSTPSYIRSSQGPVPGFPEYTSVIQSWQLFTQKMNQEFAYA